MGNYDYASRVVSAGEVIVNLALGALYAHAKNKRFNSGMSCQAMETARNFVNTPIEDRGEYEGDSEVPEELQLIFRSGWQTFANQHCPGIEIE